jgi:hypothetical protein
MIDQSDDKTHVDPRISLLILLFLWKFGFVATATIAIAIATSLAAIFSQNPKHPRSAQWQRHCKSVYRSHPHHIIFQTIFVIKSISIYRHIVPFYLTLFVFIDESACLSTYNFDGKMNTSPLAQTSSGSLHS